MLYISISLGWRAGAPGLHPAVTRTWLFELDFSSVLCFWSCTFKNVRMLQLFFRGGRIGVVVWLSGLRAYWRDLISPHWSSD